EPGCGVSGRASTHTADCGFSAFARRIFHPLELTHGSPVGPLEASSRSFDRDNLMPGQSPLMTVISRGGEFALMIRMPFRLASVITGWSLFSSSVSKQLMFVPFRSDRVDGFCH
ncbi:MAG: hypothetical protein WB819_02735, partial [Terriglobia bacterium]